MGRFCDIDGLITVVVYVLICIAAVLAVCGCGGCACFQSSRVEARADYHVFAEELDVSVVAVGYTK